MQDRAANKSLPGGLAIMAKQPNIVASIRARLLNIARQEGRDLDQLVLLYMQERLLYRLSISKYSEHFVLKGGLFLYNIAGLKSRPTKDIDFLAKKITNQDEVIGLAFNEITAIQVEDGLIFEPESVSVQTIIEDADYEGKRVSLNCSLGVMKKALTIDIGFGDIIVPRPQGMSFPVLLDTLPVPEIICYSKESVIAKKFQAMIKLACVNSRMKDFFDIYTLIKNHPFEGRKVQEAIEETFLHRETPIAGDMIIFTEAFKNDPSKSTQWNAFVKRIELPKQLSFTEVLNAMEKFLSPIWDKSCKKDEFLLYWKPEFQDWVNHNSN
jgi:predicted nucleotidyltransferase component of viral defense system